MKTLIVSLLLIVSLPLFSQVQNEQELLPFLKAENFISLSASELANLNQNLELAMKKSYYGGRLTLGASHQETNERAFIPFNPIFSPTQTKSIQFDKKLGKGLELSTGVRNTWMNGESELGLQFENINTTYGFIQLTADLWRDLGGKLHDREFQEKKLMSEKAKLEYDMSIDQNILLLRKYFWNYISNLQKIDLMNSLLASSKQQLRKAEYKYRNKVLDLDELIRFRNLVTTRESELVNLDYQKIQLKETMLNFISHDLLEKLNITLNKRYVDQIAMEALMCFARIEGQTKVDFKETNYDEMIELVKKITSSQESRADKADDVDVKLSAMVMTTGVGSEEDSPNEFSGSLSDSIEDLQDNDRSGFNVALNVVVPFGEGAKDISSIQKKMAKQKEKMDLKRLENSIYHRFRNMKSYIQQLNSILKLQQKSNEELKRKYAAVTRKYRQARIDVMTYLQDQEALILSDLSLIDIKVMILNTLFDYFNVFHQSQCKVNQSINKMYRKKLKL